MASVCLAKLRAQFKIARRRKLFLSKGVVPFVPDPFSFHVPNIDSNGSLALATTARVLISSLTRRLFE